ncbi:hypothetical protein Ancab_016503 [Ancistrocladus abbreviatus]
MESLGAFLDGEWESICKLFSTEEPEISSSFLDHHPVITNTQDNGLNLKTPSTYAPGDQDSSATAMYDGAVYFPPDALTPIFSHFSQDQSSHPLLCGSENYYLDASNQSPLPNDQILESMDVCFMDRINDGSLGLPFLHGMMMDKAIPTNEGLSNHQMDSAGDNQSANVESHAIGGQVQLKRKSDAPEKLQAESDEKTSSSPTPNKRSRASKDNPQKGKRKSRSKMKNSKEEESNNNNGESNGQSSSSDISDNESNASDEANEGVNHEPKEAPVLNSHGKKRASRGAATDPQSLYARRRRERINQRLKILQNLVPNGTKVDISTMLEEAVHYVKFLQLQIRLLSSDELWMYAPLAYNGIDIGLYRTMSPFLLGP